MEPGSIQEKRNPKDRLRPHPPTADPHEFPPAASSMCAGTRHILHKLFTSKEPAATIVCGMGDFLETRRIKLRLRWAHRAANVWADDRAAMLRIVEYLAALGHRRIDFGKRQRGYLALRVGKGGPFSFGPCGSLPRLHASFLPPDLVHLALRTAKASSLCLYIFGRRARAM